MSKKFTANWEPEHNPHTDYFLRADGQATISTLHQYVKTLYQMPLDKHYRYWGTPSHANIPANITAIADNFTPIGEEDKSTLTNFVYLIISKYLGFMHVTWTNILDDCGGLTSYTEKEFEASYGQLLMKVYYNLFSIADLFIHCPSAVLNIFIMQSYWLIDDTIEHLIQSNSYSFKPMYQGETIKDRFNLYAVTFKNIVELLLAAHDVKNTEIIKYYKTIGLVGIHPEMKELIKKVRSM